MNIRLFTALALAGASAAGAAQAQLVSTIGAGNTLVTVNAAAPSTAVSSRAITGIGAGQTLLGLDARPANNRVFYSTSNTGQLYAVNAFTGAATTIGAPITLQAGATAAAYDFNPTVDRLRVVTNTGANLRLNPDTGAVAGIDTPVAFVAADVNAGVAPRIVGTAYTNNVAGATSTTQYVIDSGRGVLAIQGSINGQPLSPNSGQLTTVGSLGVATNDAVGFDIAGRTGQALATLTNPATGVTSLYSVNLATGAATLLGALPGNTTLIGLSFAPAPLSSFTTNPNAIVAGNAIDSIAGVPTPAQQRFYNAFDSIGDNASREQALVQFTPAAYSLVPELVARTAEFQQQNVLRYLRDYRAGGTGVEGAAGEARPGDRRLGFWAATRANHGGYNAFGDRPNVNVNDYGVQLGLDGRFGEKSVLGITGGYHIVNPRLYNAARRSSIRNWFVGGYTSLAAGPAYIDAYGSYGEGEMNLNRALSFGGESLVGSPFRADGDSRTWLVGGNIGLSFNIAGFEFEPTAGVRYTNIRFGPIVDQVGGQQQFGGLIIGEQLWTSLQSNVGARIGGAIQVGQATVRPEIRGSWRREWREDDPRTIRYSIFGAPGTLAYTTTPLGRDYLVVGGGASVSGPGSPLSFVVDWTGEFLGGRNIYGISGGLRLTF